jgi:hypothetical protein
MRWSYEKERGKKEEKRKESGDASSNSNGCRPTEGSLVSKDRPEIMDTVSDVLISVALMSETEIIKICAGVQKSS